MADVGPAPSTDGAFPIRIFLTGATGFIGSHVIPELLAVGHTVVGVTRSEAGAKALTEAGVEPFHGTLEEPEGLAAGAAQAEAVIHCAFDHDFSNFVANCEKDRRVITAIGEALKGTETPFIITSGTGLGAPGHGELAVETVTNFDHPNPRIASEQAGVALLEAGVKVIVMRLPQVHDTKKQGLVTPLIEIARSRGEVNYIGEGANRWPAAAVGDVAVIYRLAVELGRAGERFHAVDEEGVSAKAIAEVLAKGLGLPVRSIPQQEAMESMGMIGMFAALDMPASSTWTRHRLGWTPTGPSLITDLQSMDYAAA